MTAQPDYLTNRPNLIAIQDGFKKSLPYCGPIRTADILAAGVNRPR